MPLTKPRTAVLLLLLSLLLFATSVEAAIQVPANTSTAFIQTTGPNAGLNIGDYRTNVAGDNQPHTMVINLACTPNQTYAFQLFDPALDAAGNPPGTGVDGVTPRVTDEIRGATDTANFQLISPAGGTLANTTYTTGTADADWTTLATVTLPAAPVSGVNCGAYTLRITTSDDDDNAWRFRLLGGTGLPETFDPALGTDGVAGTGDESWIGLQNVSYQHDPTGCQDFFWFADDGETNMYMINFDMDGSQTVTYTSPSGQTITGTVSGGTVWNDAAPQQQPRPTFGLMDTFAPPGDLAGDAIAAPESGVWTGTVCVGVQNQYSFEVPNNLVFPTRPLLPDVQIVKDDGVTTVTSPGTNTYDIRITNIGQGGALPIAGAEVVDNLPAGMSFVSCTVNAPLVGTCANAGGVININLTAQSATVPAYLPGAGAAPNNTGTITIVANIAAGLGSTSLTNRATVDFTDVFGNNYAPREATDTDTTSAAPAIQLVKSVNNSAPNPGDTITYTYTVTNVGGVRLDPVTVTDNPLGPVTNLSPTALDPGQVATGTIDFVYTGGTVTNVATASGLSPTGAAVSDADTLTIPRQPPASSGSAQSSTPAPAVALADPFITKSVQPPFALPGESVTWTITVTNPGSIPATNITVTDNLPGEVEIQSATASAGSVNTNGQSVTFTLASLAPGQSVTITIQTRVRANVALPFVITNLATLNDSRTAEATVVSAGQLPATGESPWSAWRLPLLAILIALLTGLIVGLRRRFRWGA